MTLHISSTLDLPLDILTESNAVLAKKGAGKTNGGVVIVEEAFKASVPVVVIDPKGDWYGIRSGADGSPKGGLPLPVFGGLHGDIPLESTAGAYIADLVRERGLSLVLDVSEFDSNADRRRFLTAFADRLYKRPERDPMHLMLEEAHEYIPQGVSGEDAKMVGVFERLVKLGRYKGIGITMMTQRSASLNKNVLTQVDNLFMLRTGSPQDRAAVQAWIAGHGEAKEIIDSLPSLATGEFWLWQPEHGDPVRARFRMRSTYDAGATPRIGEAPRQPATLADVDLSAISTAMAATIEKAKADDPKELRATIATLTKRVSTLERDLELSLEKPEPAAPVEVPVLSVEHHALLAGIVELLDEIMDRYPAGASEKDATVATPKRLALQPIAPPRPMVTEQIKRYAVEGADLRAGARRMVETLGRMHPLRLTKAQWGTVSRMKTSSGTWSTYLGEIRRLGFIDESPAGFTLTTAGFEYLGGQPEPMTPEELQEHYRSILRAGARRMLDVIMAQYPHEVYRDELAARAEIAATSGTFSTYLGELIRNGLVEKTAAGFVATDILMKGASA